MDGKRGPAEDPGSGDGAVARPEAGAGAGPATPRERYGPLIVERLRKDDGRALLVFSRAPDTVTGNPPGPGT